MHNTPTAIAFYLAVLIVLTGGILYWFRKNTQDENSQKKKIITPEKTEEVNIFEKLEVSEAESNQEAPLVEEVAPKVRTTPLFSNIPKPPPPLSLLDQVEFKVKKPFENSRVRLPWSWERFSENIFANSLNTLAQDKKNYITHFQIGANYSCLIGGGIGSGKTTLLHNIICQTIEKYAPSEVQLLLLDLKEGTEFFVYKDAPQVKALVTGSDITLGLSAIGLVEQEIKKRGLQFKKEGVKDFVEHRRISSQPYARWLVIIDEFQTLFYDHSIARRVEPLLDNIVRKGRSFGINFVLSTQSLSGINIAESTLSQLGIRIALRMQERDAARFLSADNTLPSTFNTAGMAVYNDNNGELGANRLFQVFPLQTSQIHACIRAAAIRYPLQKDRHILDGSAFAILERQESKDFLTRVGLVYRVGVPLNLSSSLLTLNFDTSLPERLAIVGNSEEKWEIVLGTWLTEFTSFAVKPKITILDFSNHLNGKDISSLDIHCQVISHPQAIVDKLSEISEHMNTKCAHQSQVEEMVCFYDIGAASVLRREVFDPISNESIENRAKIDAIKIIKYGPSSNIQITLFSKSCSHIEDVLKLQYESPIRIGNFEYQIYVEGNEIPGFDSQMLSEHNACIVKAALSTIDKVILTTMQE